MSHGKQFTLFTHCHGPNGWKVVFVLEELGLTYHPMYLEYWTDIKGAEHTKYNPNGRIPTVIDHANGDLVIWESNAILTYLVEKYDIEHKISATEDDDRFRQLQWLFFQASGQGPYFGQAIWFLKYHSEKVPSAVERYRKETMRVFGVLESVLSKQDWLVGSKCTIADLSFIPWNMPVLDEEGFMADYEEFKANDFPSVKKWHYTMLARDAIRKSLEIREAVNRTSS